jgi:hypothetical protein
VGEFRSLAGRELAALGGLPHLSHIKAAVAVLTTVRPHMNGTEQVTFNHTPAARAIHRRASTSRTSYFPRGSLGQIWHGHYSSTYRLSFLQRVSAKSSTQIRPKLPRHPSEGCEGACAWHESAPVRRRSATTGSALLLLPQSAKPPRSGSTHRQRASR